MLTNQAQWFQSYDRLGSEDLEARNRESLVEELLNAVVAAAGNASQK